MTLHPDFIDKHAKVPLALDDVAHDLEIFGKGYVEPPYGTYIVIASLLGEIDPTNEPDRNGQVRVMRYKPGPAGVLVPDETDNGTAWHTATLTLLPTPTWQVSWPAKFVASASYPGVGVRFRGQGGTAWLEQVILKFLRQRTT